MVCCVSFLKAQHPALAPVLIHFDSIVDSRPLEVLQSCKELLRDTRFDHNDKAHLYFSMSDAAYYNEDFRASTAYANQMIAHADHRFPKHKLMNMLNSQGQNYDYLGMLDSALIFHKKGLALAKELNDSLELSNIYYNIGVSLKAKMQFQEAINFLDTSYQIDLSLKDSFRFGHTLRLIGYMQELYYDDESAQQNYHKALGYITAEDPALECVLYYSLGSLFLKRNQTDSLVYYIQQSENCFAQQSDQTSIHYLYHLKALHHLNNQDTLAALAETKKMLQSAQKTGDQQEYFKALFLKYGLSKKENHLDSLKQTILLAEAKELINILPKAYLWYADGQAKKGNFAEAFWATKREGEIRSLQQEEKNQLIIQRQSAKFDLLQKENQLLLSTERLKTQQARWLSFSIIIGCGVLGLFFWIFNRNKQSQLQLKQEKLEQEKLLLQEISQVESQALRAQMNPHFIFNALNSIKGLIIKQESKKAALYISKFSKLVRNILDNSSKKTISLAEEIAILEMYIQLEQVRFRDGFEYTIQNQVPFSLEEIEVPPTIIQPFVENSIWHGFKNNQRQNQLNICLQAEQELLTISIQDNGIGRKKAAQRPAHNKKQSHGLRITEQRLKNLHPNFQEETIKFEDLYNDEGEALGTRVSIYIPLKVDEA